MTNNREQLHRLYREGEEESAIYLADNPVTIAASPPPPNSITFHISSNEMLRLEPNGDIYVRGRLTTNDMQVVEGLKAFLQGQGVI